MSREDGPPVPLAGLAAGAYTFAFSVDGRELARESFSLVEVPSCTGARELQVGPATHVFKPSSAEEKIVSSDAAVREQGHKDLLHYKKAALEKSRAEDDKRKQLEELVSRFKPGCLAAILPAELAAALERRNRGSE